MENVDVPQPERQQVNVCIV